MDGYIIAAVAAAFFCGGLVKGVVGMGLPLTSIALMTVVVDMRLAVPLLVVPIVTTNFLQALRGGQFKVLFRRYWSMLATAAFGVWGGATLLYSIDISYMLCILGIVVCLYSLMNLFAVRFRLSETRDHLYSPMVGIFSGFLAGTSGSVGVPVAIYYQALGMAKDVFVQAVGIQFLFTGCFMAVALAREGGLNTDTLPLSALAVIPAYMGMSAGQWARDRVSEDRFRTCLWIFLLLVGLNLIRKGVF